MTEQQQQNDPEVSDAVSLLSMAKQMLADATETVEKQKEEALAEAREEADKLLTEARTEAERLTSEAREEAESVITDAQAEAERKQRKSEEDVAELEERLTELRMFEAEYTAGLLELATVAASTIGVELVKPNTNDVADDDDDNVEEIVDSAGDGGDEDYAFSESTEDTVTDNNA